MMERRRALTLPFTVDKDNLMENPFRIPMTCLSSESGRFEGQVSWTEFASPKRRRDSTHKNGSMLFDCNHTAKVTLEMARRKPCLILTDILKTELGKFHMERIKQNCTLGSQGQMSSMQRKSGQCREDPQICREKRTNPRETRNDKNKRSPTKCNQNTTSPSSQRSRYRRRLQNAVDEVDKDEEDIKEVIIGKESEEDDKFAEVVDCGLSVSWEPAEDSGDCDEFSTASIKEYHLKRRRKDAESQCNGTGSPKRLRESVLRLNGDGRDGGPAITYICPEESGEDGDLEGLDRSIVQFTVGADDQAEDLDTIITADVKVGDLIASLREGTMSNQDNTTKTSPSEPIVLSSDEEESCDSLQHRSPTVHALVSMEDTVIQTQSSQEAETKQQMASDTQAMEMTGGGNLPPVPVSCIPSIDYSCLDGIAVGFYTLHCGGYKGKSNGDIMIANENIIIPLKDTSEQMEVTLTFGCKELRRYSVWEQQEMEAEELLFNDDEESLPPTVLLFFVSETAAAAVQKDLHKLCVKQEGNMNTDKVSPFILLTLKDHMDGMEGAVLRSLLDLDCLKNLEDKSIITRHADRDTGLDDFQTPALSLDESIELIRKTGWDPHLLSLLGLGSLDLGLDTDQDSIDSDTDKNTTPVIQLEVDSHKETILELESLTETETGTQVQPEEHEEQELEKPTEKSKEEPTPVYTLCHRRTKGSYSVSLCKPDSSWTKYKHQGLAHRLIQFPPPPLKGGITVTMEDLQCLDNGQFLNDVIIDFYLKYLLHKASAAVSERSHVFSSFFYKQLTRRDNASEGNIKDSCQRQRRHQRVKTWTRHVDIFKKDFLFVPVNQEAHWYLVVICFPGLEEPKVEAWNGSNSETEKSQSGTDESQDQEVAQGSKSPNDNAEMALTPPTLNYNDSMDTESENPQEESAQDPKPSPVSCTERTYPKKTVCKRPCILVMDSLKRSLHERVFKLLRDYLESEWEVRRDSSRDFGPDQMQSSHCKVPLQDNSSDCGLYLLQYVESFLEDPVVHFDLPLHLERWFPRQQVRRKRDEIRDLVLNLYRGQNLDNNT